LAGRSGWLTSVIGIHIQHVQEQNMECIGVPNFVVLSIPLNTNQVFVFSDLTKEKLQQEENKQITVPKDDLQEKQKLKNKNLNQNLS
jgi:hypothetical protein